MLPHHLKKAAKTSDQPSIGRSIEAMVFASSHGFRMVPVEVSGTPGFAAYARDASGAAHAMAIHVVEVREGAVAVFLSPAADPSSPLLRQR